MRVLLDKRHQIVAVVALCVIARLIGHFFTGYLVDDALITFRYAENIASGNGFVYNLNERVLGTTTPLFTLLLAAFTFAGISGTAAALFLSTMSAAFTTLTLVRFGQLCSTSKLALLPAFLYALYPRCLISDISGLETSLFTFLLVRAIYDVYRRHHHLASLAAAFACVTRPEGLGLLFIVVVVCIIDRARHFWRILLPPLIILGGWLSFAVSYFGTWIPNSIVAKSVLYQQGTIGFVGRLGQLTTLGPLLGVFLFVLLLALTFRFIVHSDRLVLVSITTIGFIGGLAVFSPRIFFWYAAPVLPLVFLILVKGAESLLSRLHLQLKASVLNALISSVLVVVTLLHLSRLPAEMKWYNTNHIAAANYLNDRASPDDVVLAEDIGHFGYHFRGHIVDRDGLVSPEAIDYNRRREYLDFIASVSADWIFIAADNPTAKSILNSRLLLQEYEESAFGSDIENRTHRLFRRR